MPGLTRHDIRHSYFSFNHYWKVTEYELPFVPTIDDVLTNLPTEFQACFIVRSEMNAGIKS